MESKKRIIIAGGRNFNDYAYFVASIETVINKDDGVEIISGHASGVDSFAEQYAKENGIALKVFPADWKAYGRAAGPIRNRQMLDYARTSDALLIALWDGKSKGTKNIIDKARSLDIECKIFMY